jgi:GxxExxY protein
MRLVLGSLKKPIRMPLRTRRESAGWASSSSGGSSSFYDGLVIGEFTTDLLVEDRVIVELKVVAALSDVHVPQCRNYLRATGTPLCLLINFGRPKVEIRRITAEA